MNQRLGWNLIYILEISIGEGREKGERRGDRGRQIREVTREIIKKTVTKINLIIVITGITGTTIKEETMIGGIERSSLISIKTQAINQIIRRTLSRNNQMKSNNLTKNPYNNNKNPIRTTIYPQSNETMITIRSNTRRNMS